MKLLLYCTKAKPMLRIAKEEMKNQNRARCYSKEETKHFTQYIEEEMYEANGKIVAECDFEVEEIRKGWGCLNGTRYFRNNVNHYYPDYELEEQSCLSFDEIDKYLKGTLNENCGYAIHIKNLKIFDKPKELSECEHFTTKYGGMEIEKVKKAPQNMMSVMLTEKGLDDYILISIRPEWLCKILNGEKTIEVRKKVLKEMIK